MTPSTAGPDQVLNGVHIFRAGTYYLTKRDGSKEEVKYNEADVKEMAENANKLLATMKHEPPAKLGHDDDQGLAKMAGLPAVGWVKRVVANGLDLFADFQKVPEQVAEAIRRGRYRHVSSEIYDPQQTADNFGDAVKGFTLRAVAFLGADVPVVKGMNPLMLAAGASGGPDFRAIVMEVSRMTAFSEKSDGGLMVNANRHGMDALVGMKGAEDKKYKIHAQHPDNTYDVHNIDDGSQVHKKVPHENLTLLSETFKEGEMPEKEAAKLAEKEAELLAEKNKNKVLQAKLLDDKINAFAEKHKATLKQPAVLNSFKAIARHEGDAAVKLAEGKELPFIDAFMAFAESLISVKPVLFGETAPNTKEGTVGKDPFVKLAEEPFKQFAQEHGIQHITFADIAVEARKMFSEAGGKKTYKECLLAVAAPRLGAYARGNYAEITSEVA